MDVLELSKALKQRVKGDLNWVYSVSPFRTPTGLDLGWYCREHAYHVALLAVLLGFKCRFIRGAVAVCDPLPIAGTIDAQGKVIGEHFWCEIDEVSPVDLSVTLRFITQTNDVPIVFGTGDAHSNPYEVKFADSSKSFTDLIDANDSRKIIYLPIQEIEIDPIELLIDPFMFLIRPEKHEIGWVEIYGEEVFAMLTEHCLKLALGRCKPVSGYLDSSNGIKRIVNWNAGARNRLISVLQKL